MEYSYNFQHNITASSLNATSENILNWIKENRDRFDWAKDPNAYEMTNLFLFGSKYVHEGKSINTETLSEMWNIRSQDFKNCNIPENNFVYLICQDAYQSAISGKPLVNDENSHHALRKMAGLGLYLKQQQRDNSMIAYNNPQELLQLLQCSKSLKTFHPELFAKYAFKENLDVLCKLQLENDIPIEIENAINLCQSQLSNNTIQNHSDIANRTDFQQEL